MIRHERLGKRKLLLVPESLDFSFFLPIILYDAISFSPPRPCLVVSSFLQDLCDVCFISTENICSMSEFNHLIKTTCVFPARPGFYPTTSLSGLAEENSHTVLLLLPNWNWSQVLVFISIRCCTSEFDEYCQWLLFTTSPTMLFNFRPPFPLSPPFKRLGFLIRY
jgi:hypothetical protein